MMQQILLSFGGGASVAVERGSVLFDGTGGDSLRVEDTDVALGTGDFTVEAFIYNNSHVNYRNYIGTRESGQANPAGWCIASDANANLYWYSAGLYDTLVLGNMLTNKWYHVACTRESGTHKWFVDGVLQGTNSTSRNYTDDLLTIGDNSYHTSTSNDEPLDGFVSNVRVVKGTALYTSNFAIPTAPLTEVTNTKLLCCQSKTSAGTAAVSPNLGGINDGTIWSSFLSCAGGFSSSAPAVNAFNGDNTNKANNAGNSGYAMTSSFDNALIFAPPTPLTNVTKIEILTRNPSSTTAGIVNLDTGSGYGSNIVTGTGWNTVYDSTAVTLHKIRIVNTYHGEDELAGIKINDTLLLDPISAYGDAAASSANPFVNGSVLFDGSGDYLVGGMSSDYSFGTGDFTIEGYFYFNSSATPNNGLWQISANVGGLHNVNTSLSCNLETSGGRTMQLYMGSAGGWRLNGSDNEFPAYQWNHVAEVRHNGTISVYINGQLSQSWSDTTDYTFQNCAVGGYYSSSYLWDGYVSNFRVVKGTALYTSNFTRPDELLTNVTNTKLLCCQSPSFAAAADVSPNIGGLNDGRVFSTLISTNYGPVVNPSYAFNGITDLNESVNGAFAASTPADISSTPAELSVTFDPAIPCTTSLRITSYDGGSGETIQYRVNNGSWTTIGNGSAAYEIFDIFAGVTGNQVSEVGIRRQKGNSNAGNVQLGMIEVDGTVLLDPVEVRGNAGARNNTPFTDLPSSAVFYASGADFTDRGPNAYTITKVGNGLTAGNSTSKSGGGSYRFDGADTEQYFYAGNNTFLDDSLSSWQFQCWARYDNTTGQAGNSSGDMGILVDQYPGSGSQGRLLFGFQDNELVMRVNGGTVELRADNNGSGLGNNIWYHVLLNWDGTTHRLFLNGVLDDSSTTVPAVYTGKRTEFGGGGDLSNYNLHGYMEHVLVEQGGTVKTSNFTPTNTWS